MFPENSFMEYISKIFAILLLVFSIYLILMNWVVFSNNYIFKKKWSSAIPLFGGIAGMLGIILYPISGSYKYSWIPLLLDWGSIPIIFVSLVFSIIKFYRDKPKE